MPGILCLLLTGCYTNTSLVINTEEKPVKTFPNNQNFSFSVSDARKFKEMSIQNDDGDDFTLNIPASDYIESWFNNSVVQHNGNKNKVQVFIDQLKFQDESSLKYSFRFLISGSKDSSVIIRVAEKYTGAVTKEKLIPLALTSCLDTFFTSIKNINKQGSRARTFTENIKVSTVSTFSTDSAGKGDTTGKVPDTVNISPAEPDLSVLTLDNVNSGKINISSLGLNVFGGRFITTGIQFYYSRARVKPEANFVFSYGAGITYFDILNGRDGYSGHLLSAAFPFVLRFYHDSTRQGLFFGASVMLMMGNKVIKYGYKEKRSFYFGPHISPFMGYKFPGGPSLEIGGFFLKYFGSDLIPEDAGLTVNFNIWF